MEAALDADRRRLERDKDMVEEERNRVLARVAQSEAALEKSEAEQNELRKRLELVEKKIFVGASLSSRTSTRASRFCHLI